MRDPHASILPRSRSEREQGEGGGVEQVFQDWSDDNWLQFSMWDLHHIQAYLARALGGAA